jgi:protein ImuB
VYACIYIPDAARDVSAALADVARTFSPLIETPGPGTVVLPVAPLRRLIGSPYDIAAEIARRSHELGLDGRIGIAANPDTAILAARNLPGVTVIPPGQERKYVGPCRLDTLPLDPDALEVLDRWGVHTLEEFAALPGDGIAERLGAAGAYLQKLAQGQADRPLRPVVETSSFERRYNFDHEVALLEPLLFIMARFLSELTDEMTSHGFATTDVCLRLALDGGTECERSIRMPFPSRDSRAMLKLLQLELEARPPGAPVVGLAISVVPVEPRRVQGGLFIPIQPEPEKLELTLAKIRSMVGEKNAGWPELQDTWRPAQGQWTIQRNAGSPPLAARHSPLVARLAFRFYQPCLKARVEIQAGMPRRLDAERGIYGNVVNAAGPWRASGDWWRAEEWNRDEWDVGLNNGAIYRIYLDRPAERWFVEGAYD